MIIKIKKIFGYELNYDEALKRFVVEDVDGIQLAHADTQDEAEVKAKALSKQEFKRIHIVRVETEGQVTMGELTSLNRDDNSAWISMEKTEEGWGSGRQKLNLRYVCNYYEATEVNLKVLKDIKIKKKTLDQIKIEIADLIKTLERNINSDYFDLER